MTTRSWLRPSVLAAILLVLVVVIAFGWARIDRTPNTSCALSAPGTPTFDVRLFDGKAVVGSLPEDADDGSQEIDRSTASRGVVVVQSDGVGASLVVLGPETMTRVVVDGATVDAQTCARGELAGAVVAVPSDSASAVDAQDEGGALLFHLDVPASGGVSGVVAPVGPWG